MMDLANELRTLEDVHAIKKLQRAYGFYIDRGYWSEAADLFAENATFEWGMDGIYAGRPRIREYLIRQGGGNAGPGLPFGQLNHHLQLQPVMLEVQHATARARWREFGMTGIYQRSAEWISGIYECSYAKLDGVWHIRSLRCIVHFVAPYAGGWATLQPVNDWRTAASRDFPSDGPPTQQYAPFPAPFTAALDYRPSERPVTQDSVLGQRLALLRSRLDIENLQGAFGYYFDHGCWTETVSLMTEDATFEYGQSGVYVGRERIRQGLHTLGPEGLAPAQANVHMMLQPIIDVAADNRSARARWRSILMLAHDGQGYWGEGTLQVEYANDGRWRISALRFIPTVIAEYDKGWGEGAVPIRGPSTSFPPDRPPTEVLQSFPHPHLPAYHYPHPVREAAPALTSAATHPDPIEQRCVRLEDIAAVERLQRAYGYYVDKLLWPEVADLFADDATLEIGGRGVFKGKARILEYLEGLGPTGPQHGLLMTHQQFQGIVDVADDGLTAAGRWTAFIMTGKAPASLWGLATYENRYVKDRGVWKLHALRAPFVMYAPVKEGWAMAPVTNTRPDSWAPPPDYPPTVVYNTFPSFYVTPFHYANPVTGKPMPPPHPAAGGVAPME